MTFAESAIYRIRQGLLALRPQLPAHYEQTLHRWLTPLQVEKFRALPLHDQAHLLRVHQTLIAQGVTDNDLLVAALLHDIGKLSADGQVSLIDRVANVILKRFAPNLRARLAKLPAPKWRLGFALAVHHSEFGAEQARLLGCSKRTCWLIAHHEDISLTSDPDLVLLQRADAQAP